MTDNPKSKSQINSRIALTVFIVLAAVLLIVDRITKNIAIAQLAQGNSIDFIPGFMDFFLVYNRGGAFGMFEGAAALFAVFAAIVVVAMIVFLLVNKRHDPVVVVAMSLIAAGALGNAFDRLTAGEVPDFLHTLFIEFPVFNFADCCLTVGVTVLVILIVLSMFNKESLDLPQSTEPLENNSTNDRDNQ
ncbi:hypothetical protein FACS1894104_3180 [Actinomycetota bacterium]|nr:hypothetical protein FACS1894104_3180 [Actinomycetota bacterium]